jgi:MarR-like DNA-binding transcriptional regulator SgrR of sgrS sRNA
MMYRRIKWLLSIPRTTFRNILRRYQEERDIQNRPGRGRKKTAIIPENK